MNDSSKVAVVLIGGGIIAPLHAEYLLSSPTCELVAIIDPYSPGRDLAERLSVLHFSDLPSLLSSSCRTPDTYIICTPSGLHVPIAMDVLKLATPKAILVEKPLSTNSTSGAELLLLAEQTGCKVIVGHHRRFNPFLEAAKVVIVSGKLGNLTAISGLWATKKHDGYFSSAKWRGSRSGGGGPVWTNFVHDIDALHYLSGSHIVTVWVTSTVNRRPHQGIVESDSVEEGAAILLQFANGIVGTFLLCDNVASPYGWETATGENPLYPKAEVAVDSYRIFGTNGTLSAPDGTIWTYDQQEAKRLKLEVGWNVPMTREAMKIADGIPFQRQTEHLGRVVRGVEEPRCSGKDGLAAVKVCEAIINALESGDGHPVTINI